jgi:hypothetical protein
MGIPSIIKAHIDRPTLVRGRRVSRASPGSLERTDGHLVAQVDACLRIGWPNGSASVAAVAELSLIG